ncbi:MAG: hypothetical protein HY216_14540 [Candidatus Rokubacteria bacterium]|nr:hypothetical protein [Candidatus Rokubacteria bacterium]
MIHGMAARTVRNFHLPLPDPTYRRLRDAAEQTNQPATALARHAIEAWLRQHRKALVREEIRRYATEMAGSRFDLDEALEAASLESLLDEKPTKKRRGRRR